MQVLAEAFGVLEGLGRHLAHLLADLAHRDQVGVHALALVQPLLLSYVAAQHFLFDVDLVRDVDVETRHDEIAHAVAVAVGV